MTTTRQLKLVIAMMELTQTINARNYAIEKAAHDALKGPLTVKDWKQRHDALNAPRTETQQPHT